jgi:hypothetical protein
MRTVATLVLGMVLGVVAVALGLYWYFAHRAGSRGNIRAPNAV